MKDPQTPKKERKRQKTKTGFNVIQAKTSQANHPDMNG